MTTGQTLGGQGEHRKSNYDLHSDTNGPTGNTKSDRSLANGGYSQGNKQSKYSKGIDYSDAIFTDNMHYIVKI